MQEAFVAVTWVVVFPGARTRELLALESRCDRDKTMPKAKARRHGPVQDKGNSRFRLAT
jgi:hypothetical protein